MKKQFLLTAVLLFCFSAIRAQENKTILPKNEIKLSYGGSLHLYESGSGLVWGNTSATYDYRISKSWWLGLSVVHSVGEIEKYHWREYDTNGSYKEFTVSKKNQGFALAPEIKWTYFSNTKWMGYGSFALGYCWDTASDKNNLLLGKEHLFTQITLFGLSYYFGKNRNYFIGGDLYGGGYKGILNIHAGYRF